MTPDEKERVHLRAHAPALRLLVEADSRSIADEVMICASEMDGDRLAGAVEEWEFISSSF